MRQQYSYGIDVNTLDKFIDAPTPKNKAWGKSNLIVDLPEYRLESFAISAGGQLSFKPKNGFESTIFVEEGEIKVDKISVRNRSVITLKPKTSYKIKAEQKSVVFVFSGPISKKTKKGEYEKVRPTFDVRDKYWGKIESIVSKDYSGKRMEVNNGKSASLEFHCHKLESYFIHSGRLLLRLKAGRGEDRFFELKEGSLTITPPGLMHQRGGLQNTVIIEIATKDEDSDSYLVEDGARIEMPTLKERLKN